MCDTCKICIKKVPETVLVEFTGQPPFGIQGKDVMLYTLGQLKCNTVFSNCVVVALLSAFFVSINTLFLSLLQVAVERAVEWGGNIGVLSPDSRFAIANMSVEFGGIAGVWMNIAPMLFKIGTSLSGAMLL